MPEPTPGPAPPPRRTWLLFGLPTSILLLWAVSPLIWGSETLYLRDVLATHYPMKVAEAEALRAGRLPLVDVYRASGQPLAGNPNALPFYPTNLFYLTSTPLWAMNLHFWLHLLLALPAFAWLGRAWGLSRPGAWAGGAVWATSGFVLSQMNFLNLVAGVALVPAFVAACLRLDEEGRLRSWRGAAAGALWALLLLAGDPITAALALAAGAGAILCRRLRRGGGGTDEPGAQGGWGGRILAFAGALGLGTLVALPQLVELLRILPSSFRGVYGYSFRAATAASWDPRQALDLLLPFPFGRLDLAGLGAFWGHRFHGGSPLYYLSLFPGALPFALVAAAGRPWRLGGALRRAAVWAWALMGIGLFFALGRFNPLGSWLFALPGVRYPVKFWWLIALGLALLAGLGFDRAMVDGNPGARRRTLAVLVTFGGALFGVWMTLRFGGVGVETWLQGVIGPGRPEAFAAAEQVRLAGTAFVAFGAAASLALVVWVANRRGERWRQGWGAGLLALHGAFQLLLLGPLLATDTASLYRTRPPLLEQLPDSRVLAHGGFGGLFGPSSLGDGTFPDDRGLWQARRAYFELYPPAGPSWGRRYAFNTSPEGLDSFLTRVTQAAVSDSSDRERLALLGASGVDTLLLDRLLAPEAAAGARLVGRIPSFGREVYAYQLRVRSEPVQLVGEVLRAPDLTAAFGRLTAPGFDPRKQAVLIGEGEAHSGPAGTVDVETSEPERLVATVDSRDGGLLTTWRAWLPLYRAWVDGEEVETVPANMHLLAVPVPPGKHRLELATDRRPLGWSACGSILGLLGLGGLGVGWKGRR